MYLLKILLRLEDTKAYKIRIQNTIFTIKLRIKFVSFSTNDNKTERILFGVLVLTQSIPIIFPATKKKLLLIYD